MTKFSWHLLLVVAFAVAPKTARGCDLCGCFTPQVATLSQATLGTASHGWLDNLNFAVAEQFTYFNTVQIDGREVSNPTDQYLESFITQLVAGYTFTRRFALQLNVPLIYRSFERPEGFKIDRGTESGLGDISLLAKFVVFQKESGDGRRVNFDNRENPRMQDREPDFTISALLLGGLKLPTGGTSRIKEEFDEVEVEGAPESGIHGHDLTLGTGSYDGIIGAQISSRYRSFFFEASTQFTVRGDGAHQYHFANDLTWNAGPGYYFVRKRNLIVGLQAVTSGEHKDVDHFRGEEAEDTGITAVYLGSRVVVSYKKFSGDLAAELPVSIDNTALQVVPDHRLRASFAVSF